MVGAVLAVWAGRLVGRAASGRATKISDQKIEEVVTKTLESMPANSTHWSTRLMAAETGLTERNCADLARLRIAAASNGKIERWHKSLKGECIRPGTPLSLDDARRLVEGYVEHYNNVRLNSAIGYITPKDMLAGRQQEIHAERDRKLEAARKQRQIRRQQAA
jgi:transposase InsO family protein